MGLLLTMKNEQLTVLVKLIADSGLRLELLVLPFLLSTVALLLFPVQMTNNQTNEPTKALKALFISCFFLEKVIIFIFAHIVLRVSFTAMEYTSISA